MDKEMTLSLELLTSGLIATKCRLKKAKQVLRKIKRRAKEENNRKSPLRSQQKSLKNLSRRQNKKPDPSSSIVENVAYHPNIAPSPKRTSQVARPGSMPTSLNSLLSYTRKNRQ